MSDIYEANNMPIFYMQKCLKKLTGYFPIAKAAPDGKFTEQTERAVKDFQKIFNMKVSGKIDGATFYNIDKEYKKILSKEKLDNKLPFYDNSYFNGEQNDTALIVQLLIDLISEKFRNIHKVALTGVMDSDTIEEIKELQRICGREVNGILDRDLLLELMEIASIEIE